MARKLVGLIPGGLLTTLPMILTVLAQPNATALWKWQLTVVVVTSLAVWMIGGTSYVRLRPEIRRRDCLVLGSLFGFFLPIVEVSEASLYQGWIHPNSPPVASALHQVGFVVFVAIGMLELPFGFLGGWLLWRIAGRPSAAASTYAAALHRRWQDLRKGRLIGGLMVAAVVPTVTLIVGGMLIDSSGLGFAKFVLVFLGILILLEIWFVALGATYLFVIIGRRGEIGRSDCLVLGTALTCTVPAVIAMISLAVQGPDHDSLAVQVVANAGAVILLCVGSSPFGFLSGWVFWRAGVRPARSKDIDAALVFD